MYTSALFGDEEDARQMHDANKGFEVVSSAEEASERQGKWEKHNAEGSGGMAFYLNRDSLEVRERASEFAFDRLVEMRVSSAPCVMHHARRCASSGRTLSMRSRRRRRRRRWRRRSRAGWVAEAGA